MTTPLMPIIYNINHRRSTRDRIPSDAVYIGRPSRWGNPYVIGRDGTRDEVIAKYRQYVMARPELLAAIRSELQGKDLVCFCSPLPCHGDVLLEIANADPVCPDCHHSLVGNEHGFDQNDGTIDAAGKLIHFGSCTYCRECNPKLFAQAAMGVGSTE